MGKKKRILSIVLEKVSQILRPGTSEQVGISLSSPLALLSCQIYEKDYEDWDPFYIIMVLDLIFCSAWLARKEGRANKEIVNDDCDDISRFQDIEYHHEKEIEDIFNLFGDPISDVSYIQKEYEKFLRKINFESHNDALKRVKQEVGGSGGLNVMNSAFKVIIMSVTRDIPVYFKDFSDENSNIDVFLSQKVEKIILSSAPKTSLIHEAYKLWKNKRLPVFNIEVNCLHRLCLNQVSVVNSISTIITRLYEEEGTVFLSCDTMKTLEINSSDAEQRKLLACCHTANEPETCLDVPNEVDSSPLRLERTNNLSNRVKFLVRVLPRSVWIYGNKSDRLVISLSQDVAVTCDEEDSLRIKKTERVRKFVFPVEGGLLIRNLQIRRFLLLSAIAVSIVMSTATVYRRKTDLLTFFTESIEIMGALLAISFIVVKMLIEDDRAVINCLLAREKVVTDIRLKELFKDNLIRDLKVSYARNPSDRQIFKARNYSICSSPAIEEGISSETRIQFQDLKRWGFYSYGSILISPYGKIAIIGICDEHEMNSLNSLPEFYVSYDLDKMVGTILNGIKKESFLQ